MSLHDALLVCCVLLILWLLIRERRQHNRDAEKRQARIYQGRLLEDE